MNEKSEETYEKAFGNFIDGDEYDSAEEALFQIVREAFKAGWNAAKAETED